MVTREVNKSETVTYCGVDLHKDSMTIGVVDSHSNDPYNDAKITKIPCKCVNKVADFFKNLPHPCVVGVEAVGFYHWFWDLVRPLVSDMHLMNAIEVRRYAGRAPKTDNRDTRLITRLLRTNEILFNDKLVVFVPGPELRALRELTRHRHQTARSLACSKNRFKRVTLKNNLKGPKNLDASHAVRWMKRFEDRVSINQKFQLRQLTDQIISLERNVKDIEKEILQRINQSSEYSHLFVLLKTVPGIGDVTAYTIIAEIGDFSRFKAAESIACFSGLTPRVFQSDKTLRYGKINKAGPSNLRWVLQQAAWVAIRNTDFVRKIFNKIRRKAGKKKAACAVARKLIIWAWAVATYDSPFNQAKICKDALKKIKKSKFKKAS